MSRHVAPAALLGLLAARGACAHERFVPPLLLEDPDLLSSLPQPLTPHSATAPPAHDAAPLDLRPDTLLQALSDDAHPAGDVALPAAQPHRRLLQGDAAAGPASAPAGAPLPQVSTAQVQDALDKASRTAYVPLEQLCRSYTPDKRGAFLCRLEGLTMDRRDIWAHAIKWTVPAAEEGGLDLDTFIRIESVEGNANMIVRHSSSRIAVATSHAHTIDRVRYHAVDLPAGETVLLDVFSNTHDTLYTIEIEAIPSTVAIAEADLKALRTLAGSCCAGNACRLEPWPQLAAEAAAPPASGGTAQRICQLNTVHCDADGHVIELTIQETGWKCGVKAMAPLGKLPRLEGLRLFGLKTSGPVQELFSHFVGSRLHVLHLYSMALEGKLTAACTGGLFTQALFRDFFAADVPISGPVPQCAWRLHRFAVTQTALSGPLPAPGPNTITRSFQIEGAAGVGSPSITASGLDLSRATHLRILELHRVALRGPLTVPHRTEIVHVTESAATGLRVAPGGKPHLTEVTLHKTALAGELPKALLELSDLIALNASDSRLSALPASWAAPKLLVLDVARNKITGNVLALLAQQPALAVAVVEGNGMTGTVEGLVRATAARNAPSRLYQLWAKDNALTGAIPEGLTRLGVWRMPRRTFRNRIVPHVLDLENNSLRGAVPDVLYESQSPNIVVDFSGNEGVTCRAVPEFFNPRVPIVLVLCDDNRSELRSRNPVRIVDGEEEEEEEATAKGQQGGGDRASEAGGGDGGGGDGSKRAAAVAVPIVVVLALAAAGLAAWWRQRRPAGQTGQLGSSAVGANTTDTTGDTVSVPAQELSEA